MSRLFTFGCSFTHWSWPTWADILGREFNYYENWGQRGAGNVYIFHSLIECHQKQRLNKDDTVIIMWSSYIRKDEYKNGKWYTPGDPTKKFSYRPDLRGKYLETLSLITAAKDLLNHWGVKHYFVSMVPLEQTMDITFNDLDNIDDICLVFKDVIKSIRPSVFEIVFNGNWGHNRMLNFKEIKKIYSQLRGSDWPSVKQFLNKDLSQVDQSIIDDIMSNNYLRSYIDPESTHIVKLNDYHPTPNEAVIYLEKVLPEFIISKKNKKWANDMTDLLLSQDHVKWTEGTQRCYTGVWSCADSQPIRL